MPWLCSLHCGCRAPSPASPLHLPTNRSPWGPLECVCRSYSCPSHMTAAGAGCVELWTLVNCGPWSVGAISKLPCSQPLCHIGEPRRASRAQPSWGGASMRVVTAGVFMGRMRPQPSQPCKLLPAQCFSLCFENAQVQLLICKMGKGFTGGLKNKGQVCLPLSPPSGDALGPWQRTPCCP